jgi:hypothetical protein
VLGPIYRCARHHNPIKGCSKYPLREPQISQSKPLPVTKPWSSIAHVLIIIHLLSLKASSI